MSQWEQHLDESASGRHPAAGDEFVGEFDDEHEEPVERAAGQGALGSLRVRRPQDLSAEDVALSGRLWRWGFLCLPVLWLVNYAFFRHTLAEPTTPDHMKRDVRRSALAFALAALLWIVWLALFYSNMHGWANPVLLFSPSTNVLKSSG